MQIKFISTFSSNPPSLLRKAGVVAGAVALVGLMLVFSALLLPVVLIGGAYVWWKTREVRKQFQQMQAQMQQMRDFPPRSGNPQGEPLRGEVFEGEIIEGEAVRVHEARIEERR